MSQIVMDIIARAAWEVADESFKDIKVPEMVKALDRVYRDYCINTRIKSSVIGFKADGTNNEFDLYGLIDSTTDIFGDNFFRLYRVQYNDKRMDERDFEYIMNSRLSDTGSENNYAIRYLGKYQRMFFGFIPPLDTEILLWYYEYPRIGTIVNTGDTLPIDDKNTDDLVLGLTSVAWGRRMLAALSNKDVAMVQFCAGEHNTKKAEWKELLLQRNREFALYRDEVTPTVMEVGEPVPVDIDTSWEQDYLGFDEML